MEKSEKEKLDRALEELIKKEVEFCEELGLEKNEHGGLHL